MKEEVVHHHAAPLGAAPAAVKRISWGAVFAGLIVALVTQLLLTMLGVGIGAATIDPLSEQRPAENLGIGAAIWLLVSGLISLFLGGWVAGRLAGIPRRTDSMLHGVLTWGTSTVLTLLLLTTAAGSLLSGAAGLLGRAMPSAANAARGGGAGEFGQQIQGELQQRGIDTESLKQQAKAMLPPGAQAKATAQEIQKTYGQKAQDPQAAEQELTTALEQFYASAEQGQVNPAQREAVQNVLVSRYNLSQEEAAQMVQGWEQKALQQQPQKQQAEQKAREAGQQAAEGVSKGALWAFFGLLLGAVAAALGGLAAVPRDLAALSRREATATP